MALIANILKANESLKDLTDVQIKAIETLSTNDENTVIAKKVGEIHGQYDNDIELVTGLKKPSGIKTYDWLKKDVLPGVKIGTDAKKELDEQKVKIKGLEKQLEDSAGDEAIKQQLKDANNKNEELQLKYNTDIKERDGKITKGLADQLGLRLDNEFEKALTNVKFKDIKIIPVSVRDMVIDTAKKSILSSNKAEFIDNGKGGKVLVFRDEKGEIRNNHENQLNPFTAKELLLDSIKDIVETGKKAKGGGSGPTGGGGASSVLDLSGAKTQVEADELIVTHLLDKGMTKGSGDFAAEQTKIREENKVSALEIN